LDLLEDETNKLIKIFFLETKSSFSLTERSLILVFRFSFSVLIVSFFSTIGAVGVSFFLGLLNISSSLIESSLCIFFGAVVGGSTV
jgi:uncharacterized membrane protein